MPFQMHLKTSTKINVCKNNHFDLIAKRKPYTGEIEINIGEASNSFSIRTRKLKLIG